MRVASTRRTQESSGHSDRIVSMLLPLKNKQYATFFSVCAPTLQAEPVEKDNFYSELYSLPQGTPADDKLLIRGNFNARVGQTPSFNKRTVWRQPGCILGLNTGT